MSSITNDLMLWSQGSLTPSKADRPIAKAGKAIYDGAVLDAFRGDADAAVAAHLITSVCRLVDHGREMAGDDPQKLMAIAPIINQVTRNGQQRLQNRAPGWGW